jgi:hypothetical protein
LLLLFVAKNLSREVDSIGAEHVDRWIIVEGRDEERTGIENTEQNEGNETRCVGGS